MGPVTPKEWVRRFGGLNHKTCNCLLTSHVEPAPISDFASYRITSVICCYFIIITICRSKLSCELLKRAQNDVTKLNWTKLNWHGVIFDELICGQTVMHYSRHRLTASLTTWLWSRTRQLMPIGLALLAHWSVHEKLNHVSSVQFSSVTSLCTRL